MAKYLPALLILSLAGCTSTRITPAGQDTYMASAHTADTALRAANQACASVHKVVKIQRIDADNAVVIFSCVTAETK